MTTAMFGQALGDELGREGPINENLITKWEQGYQVPGADVFLAVLDLAGISGDIAALTEGSAPPKTLDPRMNQMLREMQDMRGLVTALAEGRFRRLSLPLAEGPESDYITMQEASTLMSVSRATIYNRLAAGRLQGYRLGSQTVLRRSDVVNPPAGK